MIVFMASAPPLNWRDGGPKPPHSQFPFSHKATGASLPRAEAQERSGKPPLQAAGENLHLPDQIWDGSNQNMLCQVWYNMFSCTCSRCVGEAQVEIGRHLEMHVARGPEKESWTWDIGTCGTLIFPLPKSEPSSCQQQPIRLARNPCAKDKQALHEKDGWGPGFGVGGVRVLRNM